MEKLNIIFKLSFKFFNKYMAEYYKAMIRVVVFAIAGFIFVPLSYVNPIFALLTLFVTIPLFCYSFWRGYVITYALNHLAFDFLKKQEKKTFDDYVELVLENEGELAKFVGFIASITIIGYIPSLLYFLNTFDFTSLMTDPFGAMSNLGAVTKVFLINTIFLAPFINFSLQAYFFKKDESYFTLFKNCYTCLDITGILITFIVVGLTAVISSFAPIIYLFVFLPMNVIIYSLNTFWYYSRLKILK